MKVGAEWKQTSVNDVSLTLMKKREDPHFMVRRDACSSEEEKLLMQSDCLVGCLQAELWRGH